MPEISISAKTVSIFREALGVYLLYLQPFATPGNKRMKDEYEKVSFYRQLQSKKIQKNRDIGKQDWMWFPLDFGKEEISMVKASLPLLKRKFENDIDEMLEAGAPKEASEGLQDKISEIDKVMAWPIIQETESYTLIGKNHVMKKQKESEGSTVIHATIHNRDGVVVVGKDIQIQQALTPLDSLLEELITKARSSSLSGENRERLEGYARTIQSQLVMKKPDRGIVSMAFKGMQSLATLDGLINLTSRIAEFLTTHNLI